MVVILLGREEFMKTQASFQFGACEALPGIDVTKVATEMAKSRPSLFLHDPNDRRLVPADRASALSFAPGENWHFVQPTGENVSGGAKLSVERQADALNELADAGLRLPFIVDMHDAIRKQNPFPVFQYNRPIGAKNAILWPLDRVHRIGSKSFCS